MPTLPLDRATVALIRMFRERRVAAGLRCPRCESEHVVRWGRFASRQRYRCRSCSRCFSDLTATPLSYIKRLDAWPAYFRCLNESGTVRSAAATAGVGVSTSFRWRHLILGAAEQLDSTRLGGVVEFAEASFRYSEKGCPRSAVRCWTPSMYFGRVPIYARPGCIVVLALDRIGGHRAEWLDTGTLTGEQLRVLFDDVIPENAILLSNTGRYGPFGWLERTRNGGRRRLIRVTGTSGTGLEQLHNRNARLWLGRFGNWLRRFHGVATRYMGSYLAWRGILDVIESGPWLDRLLPCLTPPTAPTIPDDSTPTAARGVHRTSPLLPPASQGAPHPTGT